MAVHSLNLKPVAQPKPMKQGDHDVKIAALQAAAAIGTDRDGKIHPISPEFFNRVILELFRMALERTK